MPLLSFVGSSCARSSSPSLTLGLVLALMAGACVTTSGAPGGQPRAGQPVAASGADATPLPAASRYVTDPGGEGLVGGAIAAAIGREVLAALRERGDASAAAETTLSELAAWYYRELAAGRSPSSPQSEQAAARLGFVGALHAASAFPVDGTTRAAPPWREVLAELVRNVSVNRFGVWAAPDGGTAVVVFAAVELTLEPFPRHLPRSGTLRLRGHIAPRFERSVVYLTTPSGAVEQTPIAGRAVDVTLRVGASGVYRVEIMGDGPSGPVVLGNVPVYVDTEEPGLAGMAASAPAPAGAATDAAARMMGLLNQARRTAGVPPLVADPQLAAVALAYSREMVEGHFFGHVSPVTGTVVDRVHRAGIGASVVGENVSQGESAEAAHQGLMDSPGHRANMLDGRFTHAGIGVARTNGEPPLLATIVFARRPNPTRLTARDVLAEVAALRRARQVPPAIVDPVLQAAAEAGMKATGPGGAEATKEQAMDAGEAALVREDRRNHIRRAGGCAEWLEILERDDLKEVPLLVNPGVKKIGLAAALRATGQPPPLAVLVLVEGTGCK